jgi:hypothetical protein
MTGFTERNRRLPSSKHPRPVAITADTYAHVSPAMLQSAANRLNDLIEKRG